jgi:nickel transport protein
MSRRAILYVVAGLLAALALMQPEPALAHKVKVFAYLEAGALKGEGYMPGGGKAMNCPVKVLDAAGKLLAEGTTDREGAFTVALPQNLAPQAAPLTVVLEAGEGHRAEFQMTAQDLGLADQAAAGKATAPETPVAAPTGVGMDPAQLEKVVSKALSAQLGPIRAQMGRLADKDDVSVRDVVGGLGWILGLVGVLAWAKSRRS